MAGMLLTVACGRTPTFTGDRDDEGWMGRDDSPAGPPGAQTCKEVDFLFVIDDSGSMADKQAKLAANYDVFIDGIAETVETLESIHVGVITTDEYAHNVAGCTELGGLVVQTGGVDSSFSRCGPYADGHMFMTESDDLDRSFRCAVQVGTSGSGSERILQAPLAALGPPLTDPGGCNHGFARDGALLVLVIVTDEDVEVDPVFAAGELLARKSGGSDSLVVVALGTPADGTCGFSHGARPAAGLESFVSIFERGFFGSICGDYAEVLEDAVAAVVDACPGE